jgi:polyphosphate glucokinase
LSIDIGGTGIKMLVLDGRGAPVNERQRRLTPKPTTTRAVLGVIGEMIQEQPAFDRVSVGFPGVVRHGVAITAPNLGTRRWAGFNLEEALKELTGKPTRVINDADLQGYGVIEGTGVELAITLGTGVGSALFVDGHLVPNLELAHHPFHKDETYENRLSDSELKRIGKARWSRRVLAAVERLDALFNYDRLHLGGGNVTSLRGKLSERVRVFTNVEGLRGGIALWLDVRA